MFEILAEEKFDAAHCLRGYSGNCERLHGHTYKVQASVNLTTWSTIWQTTSTSNAWTQFQDVEGANLKMRFYRLAWQ